MAILDHLIIRAARLEDLDILVQFSAAMALETESRTLDEQRLRQGTAAVFESPDRGFYRVAVLPGPPMDRVIGQLLVTFEWSDWRNATFWWIQSVYVHPEWRRKGVYRRLHESVLQEARKRKDVCGLRLYVEQGNRDAQTAYTRVGLSRSAYQVFEEDFVLSRGTEKILGKEN